MYRFFDLGIASELPLPGLPDGRDLPAAWSVSRRSGELRDEGFDWYHTWKDAEGQEVMSGARRGNTYMLDFYGLARCTIDFADRRIDACPAAGCPDTTLAHLLLDQVLPRAVCHSGRLVLHASAVGLPNGGVIAFTGDSGRGKSTLASAFYCAGYRLLSDDCLLLEKRGDSIFAVPAYPSMRLWPDSADTLFPGGRCENLQASLMAHYTNKRVLSPAAHRMALPASPLRALYLLEPPGPLHIAATGGMTAVMGLVEAQFTLDVAGREAIRRGFAAVQEIAGHMPILRLAYPHDYRLLTTVIEAIVAEIPAPDTAAAPES